MQLAATGEPRSSSTLVSGYNCMLFRAFAATTVLSAGLFAQSADTPVAKEAADPDAVKFTVIPGTRIPLSLINSVSTKHAGEGDRVYLETVFPILVDGRVVI